jgi:hypothetical protein
MPLGGAEAAQREPATEKQHAAGDEELRLETVDKAAATGENRPYTRMLSENIIAVLPRVQPKSSTMAG